MLDYLAELRGGVDRRVRDELAERFDAAARPADARAVDGQPPEARPDPGVHARARAADPRRADRGARSARAAELPRAPRARSRRRGARSSSRRTRCPRSSGSPTASRSCAAGGSWSSTRSRACARSPSSGSRSSSAAALPAVEELARAPRRARGRARRRASRRGLRGLGRRARQGDRRPRGAFDPKPGRRPRGDLPALLPRRRAHERAGLQDGDAPATAGDRALGAGHGAWSSSWSGALFPSVGDSIGKLDLPEGRRRRCSGGADYGTITGWMRSEIGAVYGPLVIAYTGISVAVSLDGGRGGGRHPRADARLPDRALAPAAAPRPARSRSASSLVAFGTFLGLVVGVAVGGGGIAAGEPGCARRCTSRSSAGRRRRARARARRVHRAPGARHRDGAAAFARPRVPRQRFRAAGRRASTG